MLHIAFTADEKFSYPLQIAIYSLVKHLTKPATIDVISADLSDNSKKLIQKTIEKINPLVTLEFHQFNHNLVKDFPLTVTGISLAGYYRFFLAKILPYDKVLYLDCDILVTKDISSLARIRLGSSFCAGTFDPFMQKINYVQKQNWEKRIPFYINSGVLLLNLKKFREENITQLLVENLQKYREKIQYQDQDILNLTLSYPPIISLNPKYNWMTHFNHGYPFKIFPLSKLFRLHIPALFKKPYLDVSIFHFCGPKKPWNIQQSKTYSIQLYKQTRVEYQKLILE